MNRIGVFICHCRLVVGNSLDVEQVVEEIRKYPDVVYVAVHEDMCVNLEAAGVGEIIKDNNLDGVVATTCSLSVHQDTLREEVLSAGLSQHQLEAIDLMEQCGWPNAYSRGETTAAVIEAIKSAIEILQQAKPVFWENAPIIKKVLVIGGGIAGIQASLDIADGGYEVFLIEDSPSIGGQMIKYSETFPTLDCPQCIETPKMVECGQHPNIRLMAYSEVEEVSGEIGHFKVKVRRKSPLVDWDLCNGCEECSASCPVSMYTYYERGVAKSPAIFKAFPQAVPSRVLIDKRGTAPCRDACPLHMNAQAYVAFISKGKFADALRIIRENNPFPGICGRVCTHPCETHCTRGKIDEAVRIRDLKRVAADYELKHMGEEGTAPLAPIVEEKEEKVAIVGAGPAGLMAAYELRRKGYKVTILEALPLAGGMMRVGIPEYRLPRDILEGEIGMIEKMGVEIKLNTSIGKDITLADLKRDFGAVFIATGTHLSTKLGVPGEDAEGVYPGVEFLRKVNLGEKVKIGDKVAVVGGGNVAIDAARTAFRLGAGEITIVYRRTRAEMPAAEEEIEGAEEEGIKIHYLAAPSKIVVDGSKVKGMECIRMKLGLPDKSGRRSPIPIEGSEFLLEVDTVIPAIGQAADVSFVSEDTGIKIGRGNRFTCDPVTLQTSVEGIFAGGDAVLGPATVIEALAAGKKAAISIDRYFKSEDLTIDREKEGPQKNELEVDISRFQKGEFQKENRVSMPAIPVNAREGNFQEVELGLGEEEAMEEASRCISCPGCCECFSCVAACQKEAVNHELKDRFEDIEVGAIIVATGFELMSPSDIPEFDDDLDILDGIQFERILCPGGPTAGVVMRLSDSREPKEVVFVSCCGSRDPEHGVPYCSRVCCMYLVKMALLYKHAVEDGQAYIFYIDIRTTGKGYEDFVQRAVEEDGVVYLRGKVSKIYREGDKLKVLGADTLTGKRVEISCDMVVLGMAMLPHPKTAALAQKLGILIDGNGFIKESHLKLRPLETSAPGIYVAGCAQGPKDIPDSVAQGSGAASKVLSLFSKTELKLERVAVG